MPHRILISGRCLLIALLLHTGVFADEKAAPPNIVYILADDLGYKELGSYGQEKI